VNVSVFSERYIFSNDCSIFGFHKCDIPQSVCCLFLAAVYPVDADRIWTSSSCTYGVMAIVYTGLFKTEYRIVRQQLEIYLKWFITTIR